MNRRQFLRAVGLAAVASTSAVAAGDSGHGPRADASLAETATGVATPNRTESTERTGTPNGTGTSTGTPTPTPTEAVATPTSEWEPVGEVAVPGATETVLSSDGETAFVAVGAGFVTVDVTDPADPTVLARETGISPPGTERTLADAFDVKYDDGEVLVAGPANYHPDSFRGVVRYDVTDPAAPELAGAHETTFPVHNCYYYDGNAYLTGNDGDRNPLVVVDLSEPAEVARWSVLDHDDAWGGVNPDLRRLHDVWVHDGLAYLAYWDAGTWILDVSDPADPTYVADIPAQSVENLREKTGLAVYRESLEPPGNVHSVGTDPAGDLLVVGRESWNSNAGLNATTPGPGDPGGPSGVDLYDVADPSDPIHLATIDPPPTADPNIAGVWTTAHNFEVGDRYLYSSWYQGGVAVHDVSDPADPERVRYFRRSSTTSFWTAQLTAPGGAVVATSRRNPADLDAPAVVYTFPDVERETPAGAVASPSPPTPTSPPTPSSGSGDGTARPPADPTGRPSTDPTTGAGPGFGPLAALAALGVGAWRLLDDGEE